jgi:thioredoxin-related protein
MGYSRRKGYSCNDGVYLLRQPRAFSFLGRSAMKQKLEIASNLAIIILAVVIVGMYVRTHVTQPALNQPSVKVGDQFGTIKGVNWARHEQTLILALKRGCRFCQDSNPFYKRLVDPKNSQGLNPGFVAVFPDDRLSVEQYLQAEGLAVESAPDVSLEAYKVYATPTLILVDREGRVLKQWVGMLSPKQEQDVINTLAACETCKREATPLN